MTHLHYPPRDGLRQYVYWKYLPHSEAEWSMFFWYNIIRLIICLGVGGFLGFIVITNWSTFMSFIGMADFLPGLREFILFMLGGVALFYAMAVIGLIAVMVDYTKKYLNRK